MKKEAKTAKTVADELEKRGKGVVIVSSKIYGKANKKINTIYGRR